MRLLIILISLTLIACNTQKKATTEAVSPPIETKLLTSDEEQIRECFAAYKSAILNDKGPEAANYVDSRTIQYYTDILEKTKTADSTELNSFNIMDKLMVFSIRHRTAKEDILKFDGKALLVYAIEEGMVGKSSVANNEIGQIKIDEDFATGQLVSRGTPVPMYFHFYHEEKSWKMDLTSIFPMATLAFQKMADDSGQEENEYLFMLLDLITGDQPTHEIWETIEK